MLIAALASAATTIDRATAAPVAALPGAAKRAEKPAPNRTVIVTASDFAYRGLPVHAPAGWLTFRMVNAGRELHMFATARLTPGPHVLVCWMTTGGKLHFDLGMPQAFTVPAT